MYYIYNRTSFNDKGELYDQQNQVIQSFVFADYENIVGTRPNLWGFGKGTIPNRLPTSKLNIWNSIDHFVDDNGKLAITAFSGYYNNIIDTTLCFTESSEVSHWLNFENERGLVAHNRVFYHDSERRFQLMGSKINGIEEGSFEVIVGIAETELPEPTIQLYPNPAQNFLRIKETGQTSNAHFSIINLKGMLMDSGALNRPEVNITHLQAGIYFFNLTVDEKSYTLKFVKQDF